MKKKIISLCLVIALVATAIAGATLAYFNDTTGPVENTFTVGNVDIELDEPKWDDDEDHHFLPGVSFDKDPTITVEPGSDDCWIFMEAEMNKFNSWLRLVGIKYGFTGVLEKCPACGDECKGHMDPAKLLAFFDSGDYQAAVDEWFAEVKHDEWKIMNLDEVKASIEKSFTDPSIKTIKPIFGYKTVLSEGAEKTLFTKVTMPSYITDEELALAGFNTAEAKWTLTFTGHAIQAAEIATLDAAYAALFN